MDRAQCIQYIKHRLITAGGSPDIFSDEALDLIASNSGGIPRIANRICDATLLKTFMLQKETAETAEVQMAINDLGLDFRSGPRKPIRMNPYRKQVFVPRDNSDTSARQASRMALAEEEKSSQKEEEKTAQSGRGHRYRGLKLVLILGVIVILVAGIIRQLGMNGSEKIETDKSPSYKKEKISRGIAKKEPNASPTHAINDKSLGQSNVEEGSIDSMSPYPEGARADGGQDMTETQQTHSQTEAAIPNKETLNNEEKTERPEKKEPNTQETSVRYPYSVLLASYRVLKNAQKALVIYRKIGLSGFWVRVNLDDDNVWYRVFTGHFKGREEAEAFIKEKGLVEARSKKIRYANLVGVYTSENALNAKLHELSRLGYCPYVIEGIKGESQLYTGAFYTKQGAETQRSELIANGIRCQVVEQ